MALSSAFQERLEQMERTRNCRLSLLQAEKELQATKSKILASRLAEIRSAEHRCLLLEQEIAAQNLKISRLRSETDRLDEKYQTDSQQLRVLKSEVEEMAGQEEEKERFYEMKRREMMDFRETVERFAVESRIRVNELRNRADELKSTFLKLQGNDGIPKNSEIAAAEIRKSELLALKENLDKSLATNYHLRSQLQKEVENLITKQEKGSGHFHFNLKLHSANPTSLSRK